jgi:hypothetical protein
MLCYYEKHRYENLRNQNSLQSYNKKMTYANLYAIFLKFCLVR